MRQNFDAGQPAEKALQGSHPASIRFWAAWNSPVMEQPGQKIVEILCADFADCHAGAKIFLQQPQISGKGLDGVFRKTLPNHMVVVGTAGTGQRRTPIDCLDLGYRRSILPFGPALWKKGHLFISQNLTSLLRNENLITYTFVSLRFCGVATA